MSDNLSRWIAAYERMDERRKAESLAIAEATALAHPAKTPVRLRLVSGCGAARTDRGSSSVAVSDAKTLSPITHLLGGVA